MATKEEVAGTTFLKVLKTYGITGVFSFALLFAMWLILNQYIAQADCARVSNEKCQAALVNVATGNTDALIELNRTLSAIQSELARLARANEARENRMAKNQWGDEHGNQNFNK